MRIRRNTLPIDREYLIARNAWARDGRLSLRARGLLMLLLSHRSGWDVTLSSLVRENPEGREAIRSAIAELEEHGYLVREQTREGSKFASMDYMICEPTVSGVGKPDDGDESTVSPSETVTQVSVDRKTVPRKTVPRKSTTKEDHLEEDHLEEDQTSLSSADAADEQSSAEDPEPREDVEQLCKLLADCIEANGSKRPTITQRWREAARLLIDRDGKTPQQVAWIIQWCQQDEFWRGNVLSMPTLRRQFDRLRLKAQQESQPRISKRERENLAFLNGGQPPAQAFLSGAQSWEDPRDVPGQHALPMFGEVEA